MEQNDSILQLSDIDSSGQYQLNSSGRWAKFVGIVYLVIAGLMLLTTIVLFANLDLIASSLMDVYGMSNEALDFMMGAGKWIFALFMAISVFILFLNGFFLIRFGTSTGKYIKTYSETELENSFHHLTQYLMLTTILSILSTIFSLVAIAYYLIK